MRRHCKPLEMILKKTAEKHAKYAKAVLTPIKFWNKSALIPSICLSWRYLYHWNCQFRSAGEHEIGLVLKVIRPSGEQYLGRIEQTIQVVKFDHATQRQVQMGAAVTGAVALLGTIGTLLSTVLGLWHLH